MLRVRRMHRPSLREMLLLEMPRLGTVAEIGVHKGDFSKKILEVAEPKLLHLIDPWKYEAAGDYKSAWYGGLAKDGQREMNGRYASVKARFAEELASGRVVLHRETSYAASEQFPAFYFDWIYIDGNHLYKFVRQDLDLYATKVKVGGYLTGDDYGMEGWWANGVQRAVDEFVSRHPQLTLKLRDSQFIVKKQQSEYPK